MNLNRLTHAGNQCENCPAHNIPNLKKLGINMDKVDQVIALAGNPNTGKSTVFNNLTGLKQHTGNWPGKTVTRAEGTFEYNTKRFKIVDLPGTYSLLSTSTDEEIARDFILFGQPDVTVIVADSTRLERNLNLTLQVLEITDRAILCLNLMDEAARHRISIDTKQLSKELGIPVIEAEARQKKGMNELLQSIDEIISGRYKCKPFRMNKLSPQIEHSLKQLEVLIKKEFPNMPNSRWVALRLLEGDQKIIDSIRSGEIGLIHSYNQNDLSNNIYEKNTV